MKTLRRSAFSIIALIAFGGLVLSKTLVHLLTDVWWFESVGYLDTFWLRISWQVGLWLATFAAYFLFLFANYSGSCFSEARINF